MSKIFIKSLVDGGAKHQAGGLDVGQAEKVVEKVFPGAFQIVV